MGELGAELCVLLADTDRAHSCGLQVLSRVPEFFLHFAESSGCFREQRLLGGERALMSSRRIFQRASCGCARDGPADDEAEKKGPDDIGEKELIHPKKRVGGEPTLLLCPIVAATLSAAVGLLA